MDDNRNHEQPGPAEQPHEVQRNLADFLAEDLNTIVTSVAATWVAAKVITNGGNQDPPPPEAGPPSAPAS